MSVSFDQWVSEEVAERDLSGYAREQVGDALRGDETLNRLWAAQHASDDRQSGLRTWDDDEPTEAIDALVSARRACGDALDDLAEHVVRETVEGVDVHGHTVDLRHARRLEPCPGCDEDVDAFHLGAADGVVGWVCGHCGADVEEDVESREFSLAAE